MAMGLMKIVLCVATTIFFVQVAFADDVPAAADEAEDALPKRTEPLSWDDLQYTRLQEVNTVAKKITESVEESKKAVFDVEKYEATIKPLRSRVAVEKALNSIVSENRDQKVVEESEKIKGLLCTVATRFKKLLKSTVSLAELIADDTRTEFLDIVKGDNAEGLAKSAEALRNLAGANQVADVAKEDVIKTVNENEYPKNLGGRKKLAYKKLGALNNYYVKQIDAVSGEANYALNAFFEGTLAAKNIQRELKSTQAYPENIKEEEEIVKKALAAAKTLGCFNKEKKTEGYEGTTPAPAEQ